jgi:hypothetical protein
MTEPPEAQGHSVFVGDFVHLQSPVERLEGFATDLDRPDLDRVLEAVPAEIAIRPGAGFPTWAAEVTIGRRRTIPTGSAVDVHWTARDVDSPVEEVHTVLSLETAGLDHARLGVEAVLRIRPTADDADGRWLGEELCRAILVALRNGLDGER